ncbi:MAG: hypothetical protein V1838_02485 [Patescibacteria group bacterium]
MTGNKYNNLSDIFRQALAGQAVNINDRSLVQQNQLMFLLPGAVEYHRKFWQSVNQLNQLLDKTACRHLFIKTIKPYPYNDGNIDVVCATEEDFSRAVVVARKAGRQATMSYHEPDKIMFRLYTDTVEQKPAWHLHRAVSWNGVNYLGNQSLFADRIMATSDGVTIPVPGPAHAILINAGHALFENFVIPLGELYDTSENSILIDNWPQIYAEARQSGWERGLMNYLSLIASLAAELGFRHALPADIKPSKIKLRLPLPIPLTQQLKAFAERLGYNCRYRHYRYVCRESYAYPLFYLIEKFKHLIRYE